MATPATNLNDLIDGVSSILTLEKMMGNQSLELDPETLQKLRAAKQSPQRTPARVVTSPSPVLTGQAPTPQATVRAPERAPSGDKANQLATIAQKITDSDVCALKHTAVQAVPGHGNPNAELVIIGEAPGREEDEQGLPFVGESGRILDRLLEKAGIERNNIWIGNIVKWRPPNNRTPTVDEIQACLPFLEEQIAVIQPKVIFCLGGVAAKTMLDTTSGIMKLRGTWHSFEGIPVMPTFHPAYLQRCEGAKKKKAYSEVWSDMQEVLKKLSLPVPS